MATGGVSASGRPATNSTDRVIYFHVTKAQEVALVQATVSDLPRTHQNEEYYKTECTKKSRRNQDQSISPPSVIKDVKENMKKIILEEIDEPSNLGFIFQARFGTMHFLLRSGQQHQVKRTDELRGVQASFYFGIPFDAQYFIQGGCVESCVQTQVKYKVKFVAYIGAKPIKCNSHVEKQEDGSFKLIWTRVRTKGNRSNFDIVRPGGRGNTSVDMRITCLTHKQTMGEDTDVYQVAERIAKSMQNPSGDELLMKVAGVNFYVEFIRKKSMQTYTWKSNPDWKIIHCDANNCKVDFNSRKMRDEGNYDPVSIHFNDAVKEIYFNGATHYTKPFQIGDTDVKVSTPDEFLSGLEDFIGESFYVAVMLEDI